jgi:hypothetical protein
MGRKQPGIINMKLKSARLCSSGWLQQLNQMTTQNSPWDGTTLTWQKPLPREMTSHLSASAKQLPKQNIFFPLKHPAALLREFAN